jgi:hypothetical protein
MQKLSLLPIRTFVVLPFRAMIAPLRVAFTCPGDAQPTTFEIRYSDVLPMDSPMSGVSSTAWTQLFVETYFSYPEGLPEPGADWFGSNGRGVEIVDTFVLPQINEFLLRLKSATTGQFGTEMLRSVGALDLVAINLHFRGQSVFARVNATMVGSMNVTMFGSSIGATGPALPAITAADLATPVPHEWAALVRATDLVNHGYFQEGFVTAFALLDASVQDFVRTLLQGKGLTARQAKELLRSIESDRLRRYLELVLPVLGVSSPLGDRALAFEFTWLNKTRNKLMHAGQRCNLWDAQRGVTAVLAVLRSLNLCGASYVLPASLAFWSPPR